MRIHHGKNDSGTDEARNNARLEQFNAFCEQRFEVPTPTTVRSRRAVKTIPFVSPPMRDAIKPDFSARFDAQRGAAFFAFSRQNQSGATASAFAQETTATAVSTSADADSTIVQSAQATPTKRNLQMTMSTTPAEGTLTASDTNQAALEGRFTALYEAMMEKQVSFKEAVEPFKTDNQNAGKG